MVAVYKCQTKKPPVCQRRHAQREEEQPLSNPRQLLRPLNITHSRHCQNCQRLQTLITLRHLEQFHLPPANFNSYEVGQKGCPVYLKEYIKSTRRRGTFGGAGVRKPGWVFISFVIMAIPFRRGTDSTVQVPIHVGTCGSS